RAQCLPIYVPAGHARRGWITLVVVPKSLEPRPQLTPEFRRRLQAHLAARVPATVVKHVRIIGPRYAVIRITAEIVPLKPDEAAQVEVRVRNNLNRFLHPL